MRFYFSIELARDLELLSGHHCSLAPIQSALKRGINSRNHNVFLTTISKSVPLNLLSSCFISADFLVFASV